MKKTLFWLFMAILGLALGWGVLSWRTSRAQEEPPKAAAATLVKIVCGEPQVSVFRADHPFIFLIADRISGNILFLGRVNDPRER